MKLNNIDVKNIRKHVEQYNNYLKNPNLIFQEKDKFESTRNLLLNNLLVYLEENEKEKESIVEDIEETRGIIISEDRYDGCYFSWAFDDPKMDILGEYKYWCFKENFLSKYMYTFDSEGPEGSDPEAMNFWDYVRTHSDLEFGLGATPLEALENYLKKGEAKNDSTKH